MISAKDAKALSETGKESVRPQVLASIEQAICTAAQRGSCSARFRFDTNDDQEWFCEHLRDLGYSVTFTSVLGVTLEIKW